jgi:RNA polymerase sigma-70 factor (ECF subfamily)
MAHQHELPSDEDLARQTQAGSLVAFEELVSRYEHRIYAFVANCTFNATDAREITQDAFVRAFQAITRFDPRHSFAPWLFTIARRISIDRYRAAPRISDEPIPELPDLNDPAESLARLEAGQDLWRLARRRLPAPQFQALWLKYAEDMPVNEIARVLRKTRTHVKVLLFRARQTLGQVLELQAQVGTSRATLRVVASNAAQPARLTLHASRP